MGLYPRNINEYLLALGIPRSRYSKAYLVDPVNGSDTFPGTNFAQPLASVETAFGKCVADRHDAVVLVPGDTANLLAAPITWNKDYTHLVAMQGLHGLGSRARITGDTALDAAQLVTFSGHGCEIKGVQFYNGSDADTDSGAVIDSGGRNHFVDCMFAGMAHTTPGARAGAFSLKVSGSESLFERCHIGLDTILRAAANAELVNTGGRNQYKNCMFVSYSETAGKFLAEVGEGSEWTLFQDCVFKNKSVNWAQPLTNAFKVSAASTYYVIMQGKNMLIGITGWADVVTHMYSAEPVPNAGWGVAVAPSN